MNSRRARIIKARAQALIASARAYHSPSPIGRLFRKPLPPEPLSARGYRDLRRLWTRRNQNDTPAPYPAALEDKRKRKRKARKGRGTGHHLNRAGWVSRWRQSPFGPFKASDEYLRVEVGIEAMKAADTLVHLRRLALAGVWRAPRA